MTDSRLSLGHQIPPDQLFGMALEGQSLLSAAGCCSLHPSSAEDQKDSRGEAVMMQRLRPFVAEGLSDEDYAVPRCIAIWPGLRLGRRAAP